jgi:ABC-2 type transport system ATP-binding protein
MQHPLELRNVTKTFGATTALTGIDLTVAPGETLALLGPNGAGKTTAIRTALGIVAPTTGTARLFGRDPRASVNRRNVGTMLQIADLPRTLTVREHVRLFSAYYPHPLPVAESLAIAGLTEVAHARFGTLSGGQRQRVYFALAVCGDPELLVLDEPTVGLDTEARRGVWERIRAFVGRGRSVLLTTHYLDEADALADRVAVIARGRIVANATPSAIKALAGGQLVRCRSAMPQALLAAVPCVDSVARSAEGYVLATRDADAVVRALYASDPTFTLIDVASTALEDAVMTLAASAPQLQEASA